MSIREIKLAGGERFVLLADLPWSLPDLWVTAYCVSVFRPKGRDATTMRNALEGIAKGKAFFAAERRLGDLRARALEGPLTTEELAGLAAACSRREKGGPPLRNAAAHYDSFCKYFDWLRAQKTDLAKHEASELEERRAKIARSDEKPPRHKPLSSEARLGLTQEQRDMFLRIIAVDCEDNPFGEMSFRNFVILWTSYHHGLRTGELLGLKLEDLHLTGLHSSLTVVVRPDDPADPRMPPAAQKTQGRVLPIDAETALMLDHLIEERRALMRERKAAKHPFLFTNDRGAPLGARGLRAVFEKLRVAEPELAGLVNHMLRHDWNDRWLDQVKNSGLDPVSALETQQYAMGWRRGSTMTSVYGIRARRNSANEFLRAAQERNIARAQGRRHDG